MPYGVGLLIGRWCEHLVLMGLHLGLDITSDERLYIAEFSLDLLWQLLQDNVPNRNLMCEDSESRCRHFLSAHTSSIYYIQSIVFTLTPPCTAGMVIMQ